MATAGICPRDVVRQCQRSNDCSVGAKHSGKIRERFGVSIHRDPRRHQKPHGDGWLPVAGRAKRWQQEAAEWIDGIEQGVRRKLLLIFQGTQPGPQLGVDVVDENVLRDVVAEIPDDHRHHDDRRGDPESDSQAE